jgi:hypothetical protein
MNFLSAFFPFLIRAPFHGADDFAFPPLARTLRAGVAAPALP